MAFNAESLNPGLTDAMLVSVFMYLIPTLEPKPRPFCGNLHTETKPRGIAPTKEHADRSSVVGQALSIGVLRSANSAQVLFDWK